jgi:hypothetical protein
MPSNSEATRTRTHIHIHTHTTLLITISSFESVLKHSVALRCVHVNTIIDILIAKKIGVYLLA